MMSIFSRRPGVALALAALGAVAGACSRTSAATPADTAAAKPAEITITPAQRQRIHLVTIAVTSYRPIVEATGTVAFNGDHSTQVLSTVSGPATKVLGQVGQTVTAGTPLAIVSSPDFASAVADYRKAQATYRNAKRVADRDSALFANDALARADLEQAQTDLASAEADVEAAVQNMRALGVEQSQIDAVQQGKAVTIEAVVRAPISGTIVEKLISDGQLLQAGSTACFTIADLSTMWVMTNVYANDLANVAVGEVANVHAADRPTPVPGRVDYVASLADPNTNAVSVRVVAPNPNQVLRKDMFVTVDIEGQTERRGILIPSSALLRDEQNLPYVYVAQTDGSFARHAITIGPQIGEQYVVAAGLMPGDQVVTDGSLFLQFAESQ